MNSELKEIGKQLKEILDKYPSRQKEILFYIFGEDNIKEILNKPTYEELEEKVNQLNRTLEVVEALLKKHIQDINQKIDFEIDMGSQGDYHKIKNFEITIRILKEILNEVGGFNG